MTEWDQYTAYVCRHRSCQDDCINHVDSAAAQTKQCWECYHQHDPDELSSITNHLPSSAGTNADAPLVKSE